MEYYQYSPLNNGPSEIRLLTLLPDCFDGEIFITMETLEVTGSQVPHYEALSYTWGPTEHPVAISVLADNGDGALAVTQNLALTLRYLRSEDEPRVLWIDAICINQKDLEERSRQVARMADVYKLAERVVVWLGPEGDDSAKAVKMLNDLSSRTKIDWSALTFTTNGDGDLESPRTDLSKDDHVGWVAVLRLLERSWFDRLWIWQEIRLANDRAVVYCGHDGILWKDLLAACFSLNHKNKPVDVFNHSGSITKVLDIGMSQKGSDLKSVLLQTAYCKCTDQRDRVFAVLNLVTGLEKAVIEPNYSKSIPEVYQDLVVRHLERTANLSILTCCEIKNRMDGAPSWVPNWSVPRTCFELKTARACWKSKALAQWAGSGTLIATGAYAATIDRVEKFLDFRDFIGRGEQVPKETCRTILTWVAKTVYDNWSSQYTSGGTVGEAFCRTICAGYFADSFVPPVEWLPTYRDTKFHMDSVLEDPNSTPKGWDSQRRSSFWANVFNIVAGRCFYTTFEGYIGLAPEAAEPDDQVCVLLGCQSPLLLRPKEIGFHEVVGECYIHGLMDGAAFLGSLPDKWQRVGRVVEGQDGSNDAFVNRETGVMQADDPRIGRLPAGWRVTSDESRNGKLFVNDLTGEVCPDHDPRMSAEALRNRGIGLVEFTLQ